MFFRSRRNGCAWAYFHAACRPITLIHSCQPTGRRIDNLLSSRDGSASQPYFTGRLFAKQMLARRIACEFNASQQINNSSDVCDVVSVYLALRVKLSNANEMIVVRDLDFVAVPLVHVTHLQKYSPCLFRSSNIDIDIYCPDMPEITNP
jgi:hypothetical protein